MRYFLDCEFQERKALGEDLMVIDPISIGLVSEDDRTYEAYFNTLKYSLCSPWIINNVLNLCPPINSNDPLLNHREDPYYISGVWEPNINEAYESNTLWRSKTQVANDLMVFLDIDRYGAPEFWGYFPASDWVMLYQIYGPLISLPSGWPYRINDIKQTIKRFTDRGIDVDIPPHIGKRHSALDDAKYHKELYTYFQDYIESKWP